MGQTGLTLTFKLAWGHGRSNQTQSFTVGSPSQYIYYKFLVSAASGADTYLGIREIELWGSVDNPSSFVCKRQQI